MNQKELKEKIKEIASKWLKEALEDKYITKYGLDGVDVAVDKYENKLVEELSSLLTKPSVEEMDLATHLIAYIEDRNRWSNWKMCGKEFIDYDLMKQEIESFFKPEYHKPTKPFNLEKGEK